MLREFYRRLAERSREKEKKFKQFVEYVKSTYDSDVTLVLFGSRARGDYNMLSDYDTLILCSDEVYARLRRLKPTGVQLFHINPDKLDEAVALFNTILVDAVVEGVLLHDGLNLWDRVRERVFSEISRRGVGKTDIGWVRKQRENV